MLERSRRDSNLEINSVVNSVKAMLIANRFSKLQLWLMVTWLHGHFMVEVGGTRCTKTHQYDIAGSQQQQ